MVQAAIDAKATTLCNYLSGAGTTPTPLQKAKLISAYQQLVKSLVPFGWLTADQAATLVRLASAI